MYNCAVLESNDGLLRQLEVAPSGERLRRKGRHGVFVGKTVLSMPERFEIYIVYKRRYINTLPFLLLKQNVVSRLFDLPSILSMRVRV